MIDLEHKKKIEDMCYPQNVILKYTGNEEHKKPYRGIYIHKPKEYDKDVFIKQLPLNSESYCAIYWYFDSEQNLGSWRLILCIDPNGDSLKIDADPSSKNYGRGNFFVRYKITEGEKFQDSNEGEIENEEEFIIKFYD